MSEEADKGPGWAPLLPLVLALGLVGMAALKQTELPSTQLLLAAMGIFGATLIIVQLARWQSPLFQLLPAQLGPGERFNLHRALARASIVSGILPVAALLLAWFRGNTGSLAPLFELSLVGLGLSALMGWTHQLFQSRYLHGLEDPRKQLSSVIMGWRTATIFNFLLQLSLWGAIWLRHDGGMSLASELQAQLFTPTGGLGIALILGAGALAMVGHSAPIRRVLGAQAVSFSAIAVGMADGWSSLHGVGNPVSAILLWTGLGVLISVPWVGPDRRMYRPVGRIRLPLPLQMPRHARLQSFFALALLVLCWQEAGLPWVEPFVVGMGVVYSAWASLRRKRLEYLLTGQTRQLRKDKERVEELNQVLADSFSKFVPKDVVDELVAQGELTRLRGEEREVTILFSDIRGYSTIIETMPPIRVLKILNHYFGSMEKVIEAHGGTIVEYIGDAILAVFGAPGDLPDHAQAAAHCAVEMREALTRFNAEMEVQGLAESWRTQGFDQLGARIGIHRGHVVAGTMGGVNQVRYGVLGDTVNVAARLEAYNKELGTEILFSDTVFDSLEPEIQKRAVDHGAVRLRGRSAEQRCYSI